MRRVNGVLFASAVGIASAVGCGKSATRDQDDCLTGSERCACYRNDTCDGDLECRSGLCVEGDSAGASGSGAGPSGGAGNATSGGSGGSTRGGNGGTASGGTATGDSGDGGVGGDGADDPGGAAGAGNGGTAGALGGAGAGGVGGAGAGGAPGGAGAGGALGGAGSGGYAGTGGSTCGSSVGTTSDTLIDNLEDRDNAIAPPRVGYWYTYSDGSCAITPPVDPSGRYPFPPTLGAGQSASVGARVFGGPCPTWGAGIGFDLNNCNAHSRAYDAQAFQGISFWYKSTAVFRFIVITTPVIPTTRGGTCVPSSGMGMECDNGHGVDLPAAPTGTLRAVPFSQLTQSFGQMKAFDKTLLVMLQWQVPNGVAFDVTIDDVAFMR